MQPDSVAPLRRRVVFEDPDLPHQIVIMLQKGGHRIMVSCNCLRAATKAKPLRPGMAARLAKYEPLEVRTRWEAAEAIAVWRAHMAEVEAT